MARVRASQPLRILLNSFVAGELSRHMDGRTDHAKYYHGCRRLENFIVRPQGSVYRRPGSVQVAEVPDSDYKYKLIPFNHDDSANGSYMLIEGKDGIYVGYQGALLQSGGSPYQFTPAFHTTEDEKRIRYHQIGDIVYLMHDEIASAKITRVQHDPPNWTIADVEWLDGPYNEVESGDSDIVLTPSAYTGTGVTLTASSALFDSLWVGRHIRLGHVDPSDAEVTQWGWCVVKTYVSPTVVTVDIMEDFGQQHVTDPDFDIGLAGWADDSKPASTVTYDAVNKEMDFNHEATGFSRAYYETTVTPGVPLTVLIDRTIPAGYQMRLYIGSTALGTNYLGTKTFTTSGSTSYTFTPSKEDCFITLDSYGSPASPATLSISTVSLLKTDLSTNEWRKGAIYGGVNPNALCLHEQRLIMAIGRRIYGSKSQGQYETFSFSTPVLADDAFTFQLAAPKVRNVKWLLSSEDLLVGTNAAELRILPGVDGDYLSAESPIKSKTQSNFGSRDLNILEGGASALFASPTGKVIRDLPFEYSAQKFKAIDITQLAEQALEAKVTAWCWASEPEPIIWCAMEDGTLAACTYMPDQDVFAWHRHALAGPGAEVEDIASIPGDGYTQVWMIVKRTIGGNSVRYIEYFETKFSTTDFIDDARYARFLDCAVHADAWNSDRDDYLTLTGGTTWAKDDTGTLTATGHTPFVVGDVGKTYFLRNHSENIETRVEITGYTSTSEVDVKFLWDIPEELQAVDTSYWAEASTTIGGLSHLEGEEVSIMADGNYIGEDTVSDGTLTLASPAVVTSVGYKYTSLLQPMRLEVPTYGATLQTRDKRIVSVTARVIDTVGGEVCPYDDVEDRYEPFNPFLVPVVGGEAPKLANGDNEITPAGGDDTAGIVTVRQADPFPMTIVCLIPKVDA